jgi:hypothetical protein
MAIALANEKMEVVRNLAFDDISLTTGDSAGNLQQNEDVVRSGRTFRVFTQIKNEDDPFDGTVGGSPDDSLAPIDYKFVKITIFWDGEQHSLFLSSRFVPAGIEQPSPDRGVLVINVTSDKKEGAIVPQSTVRIQNSDTGFDETHSTDNLGRLMLVGLKKSDEKKYQITVTKNGYETVATMPPYPDSPYNPVHENARIIAQALNQVDIYQNELANFSIETVDYLGNTVPDINYYFNGGRKIGTDVVNQSSFIYTMDSYDQTGSDGKKDYGSVNPGQYVFTLDEANREIIGADFSLPLYLSPGSNTTLTVKTSPTNTTSLLVKVEKNTDNTPIAGAHAHLTNGSGYDTEIITDNNGMAFFPNVDNPPFNSGLYNLSVSAAGFQDYSSTDPINVAPNVIKNETVLLEDAP